MSHFAQADGLHITLALMISFYTSRKYDARAYDSMLDTKSRSLTIKEIAPKWARRIEELPLPATSIKRIWWGTHILFARTCVVGEAHGSDDYVSQCETCRVIGSEFVTTFITGSFRDLKKNEQRFVEHWNEKHRMITRSRKQRHSDF